MEAPIRGDFHGDPVDGYGRIDAGYAHNPDGIDLDTGAIFGGDQLQCGG
ncbi:MAG: hypothetical protein IH963_13015 [Chloroflexi bacterium]|nr:hypothetical protein [Chloroflexota bacterium]